MQQNCSSVNSHSPWICSLNRLQNKYGNAPLPYPSPSRYITCGVTNLFQTIPHLLPCTCNQQKTTHQTAMTQNYPTVIWLSIYMPVVRITTQSSAIKVKRIPLKPFLRNNTPVHLHKRRHAYTDIL